jgi:hypothetical protein
VTGADFDEFEIQICERLQSADTMWRQIGRGLCGPAIRLQTGRFVLGSNARRAVLLAIGEDRDRLRQQVLEAMAGSSIVWSADWYLRPQNELKKIEAAIAAAHRMELATSGSKRAVPLSFEMEIEGRPQVLTAVVEAGASASTSSLYVEISRRKSPGGASRDASGEMTARRQDRRN